MAIHIQRIITLAVLAVVMFASLVGVSLAEDAAEELTDEGSGRDVEVSQPDAGVVEAPAEAFPVAPAPADPADAEPVAPSDADLIDDVNDRTVDVPEARRSVSPSVFASLPGAADSQPPAADPDSQDPGNQEEEPAAEEPAGEDEAEEEEAEEPGTEEEETSTVPELLLDWHRLIIIAERGIPDYRPYEPPPAPEPDPNAYDPWLPVRLCESTNTYNINTGNGFYGAYQFTISTWNWVAAQIGRDDLVGLRPDLAAPADQDRMADALAFEVPGGGLGHWPHCGLRYGS